MTFQEMLVHQLKRDPDATLNTVSAVLQSVGVRSLIVAVDDKNIAPYVASTIGKGDITIPMVQGFVYVLLEQAGVENPSPQAAMAANFVVNYVRKAVRE